MPRYQTELFGQVIYSAELSYDELLALEGEVQAFVSESLKKAGGQFLSFESEGDRTFFQCAFKACDEKLASKLAGRFAERMDDQLESKLLFVKRRLDTQLFYGISNKKSKLQKIVLPMAGVIDQALRDGGE